MWNFLKSEVYKPVLAECVRHYCGVPIPGGQNKVTQSQVHGGVAGKFWELVKFIQLHHIWPHAQSFSALIGLVERLEVGTHAWN